MYNTLYSSALSLERMMQLCDKMNELSRWAKQGSELFESLKEYPEVEGLAKSFEHQIINICQQVLDPWDKGLRMMRKWRVSIRILDNFATSKPRLIDSDVYFENGYSAVATKLDMTNGGTAIFPHFDKIMERGCALVKRVREMNVSPDITDEIILERFIHETPYAKITIRPSTKIYPVIAEYSDGRKCKSTWSSIREHHKKMGNYFGSNSDIETECRGIFDVVEQEIKDKNLETNEGQFV